MKKFNKIKMLAVAFALSLTVASTVNAKEAKLPENAIVSSELKQSGDLYLPNAYDMTINQTTAKSGSVTVSWNALSGANGYRIMYGKRFVGDTSATSMTINLAANEKNKYGYVYVIPYIVYNNEKYGSNSNYAYKSVYPAPTAVLDSAVTVWNPTKKSSATVPKYGAEIDFAKSSYYPDGYVISIYDLKNKKIKTINTTSIYNSFSIKKGKLKKCWNKGLKYEVVPYVKDRNNKVWYGDSTGKKVFIPQATMTVANSKNIKWKKVNGAKGYYVYFSNNYGKKFKKVKTVGKNTTSAYISGYKPNAAKRYQIYVIPYGVKVGGKKYKGTFLTSHYYREIIKYR